MIPLLHRMGRNLGLLVFVLAGITVVRAAEGDAAGSVLTPQKRQEVIEQAAQLLAAREISPVANNPFHPVGFQELVAGMDRPAGSTTGGTAGESPAQPAGPRSNRDLVQAIGAGLKPSGFFVLGGQPTLIFGQKRVKAGGILTITFEGTQYTLEITTITPPNFTLRLNREEFTRTIK
ncbi:MAG: hypothetical protein PSV13_19160 [Lacunisphaera sp.]|nr:hypothetical protein [Lacunisphaera sp.]